MRDNKLEYLETGAGEEAAMAAAAAAAAAVSVVSSFVDAASGGTATRQSSGNQTQFRTSNDTELGSRVTSENSSSAKSMNRNAASSGNLGTTGSSNNDDGSNNLGKGNSDRNSELSNTFLNSKNKNREGQQHRMMEHDSTSSNGNDGSYIDEEFNGSQFVRSRAETTDTNKDTKDWEVAREVGEAPRGFLNLDDVAGFFVFGRLRTDPVLDHHVRLCSARHAYYHQGSVKLFFCGPPGRPSWRLALGDDCNADIHKFFTCVERCLTRGTVIAAGWVVSPGTINYNRRYVLLLSTGRVMVFKDASLDNLRRELWLGENGCSIIPVKEPPAVNCPEERTWLEALAKTHDSSRSYNDILAIRIMHPSLAEKKGYLLAIERLDSNESAASHGARYREWLRLLQSTSRSARVSNIQRRSVSGQFEEFSRKMISLRHAEESRLCLERMVLARDLLPCPSLVELARAGLTKQLRPNIWKGICQRASQRWLKTHPGACQALPRARTPGFAVPLMSCYKTSDWLSLALRKLCGSDLSLENSELVRDILEIISSESSNLALTVELVRISDFLIDTMQYGAQQNHDTILTVLRVLLLGPFRAYHSAADSMASVAQFLTNNSSKAGIFLPEQDNAQKQNSADKSDDSDGANDHGRDDQKRAMDRPVRISGSAALQVDTQIVLDIVREMCPALSSSLLEASRPIVRTWLRSLFVDQVPFSAMCTIRIWDVLIAELDSDDDMHLRDRAVQIAIVALALAIREAAMPLEDFTVEAWQKTLTESVHEGRQVSDDELRADAIVFAVTRDRELLRATRWIQLKERRSHLWNSLELESRDSAVLVSHWKATIRSLDDLSNSILDSLNKVNLEDVKRDRLLVSQLTRPIHTAMVPFTSLLQELLEALRYAHLSLLKLTSRAAQAHPAFDAGAGLDRILDESTGCTNLFFSAAGQVAVSPTLVNAVAKSTIAVGWAMASACDQCIAFADTLAYRDMRMLSRCVPMPHLASTGEFIGPTRFLGPSLGSTGLSGIQRAGQQDSSQSHGGQSADTASFIASSTGGQRLDVAGDGNESVFTTSEDGFETTSRTASTATRRRMSPDFRSKSLSFSLSGVSRLVRPPGDPKQASVPLAQRVYDELCRLLHSLLIHMDDMAQCMVDTSVASQRRRSEQSPLTACTVYPDPFGGQVQPLAKLVPFLMRNADLIRAQALPIEAYHRASS